MGICKELMSSHETATSENFLPNHPRRCSKQVVILRRTVMVEQVRKNPGQSSACPSDDPRPNIRLFINARGSPRKTSHERNRSSGDVFDLLPCLHRPFMIIAGLIHNSVWLSIPSSAAPSIHDSAETKIWDSVGLSIPDSI
ncbi:hypothetical protein CEXT_355721 [Caerostris extrusa]|uniref:Uncharacterized protein n=1 Tax=Caerostris extrusa TaxID=172846 RepID=A0AAV4MBY3_CAEEX|nr:hypothetical protein CEXT_355721 [Caerostris extrusa]